MIPLPIPTLWIPNFTAHRLGGQRGKKKHGFALRTGVLSN